MLTEADKHLQGAADNELSAIRRETAFLGGNLLIFTENCIYAQIRRKESFQIVQNNENPKNI